LIAQLSPEYGFDVAATLTSANNSAAKGLTQETLKGVDVAVEFSTPATAAENLQKLAALGINTVAGATGWSQHLPAVEQQVLRSGAALVWAPNFSVGMNLFMQAVSHAAALFAPHGEYEAWGWEIHHSAKKDSPSGSLRKLSEQMAASGYTRPIQLSA